MFKQTINQSPPATAGFISLRRNYFRVRFILYPFIQIQFKLATRHYQYRSQPCSHSLTAQADRTNEPLPGMYSTCDTTRQQRRQHAKRISRTSYPPTLVEPILSTCRSFGIADKTNKRTRHYPVHTTTPRHHWLLRRCSFKQTINQISPPTGGPISPRRNYFRVILFSLRVQTNKQSIKSLHPLPLGVLFSLHPLGVLFLQDETTSGLDYTFPSTLYSSYSTYSTGTNIADDSHSQLAQADTTTHATATTTATATATYEHIQPQPL
jgi:hypothetical protein